jgi:AcrR family transcriptional regulator
MSKSERRVQIIEAARRVFLAAGPGGARVRDIAEEAGVNEALIYQHFRSKEELFDAAVVFPLERVVARIHADFAELPTDDDGGWQRETTTRFVRGMLEALTESASLLGVVLFSDHDAGAAFYRERIVPVLDLVVDSVRANLASWTHRDFDPAIATQAVFGMCWGLAVDAHFRGRRLDLDAVTAQLTDLVFEGLTVDAVTVAGLGSAGSPSAPGAA